MPTYTLEIEAIGNYVADNPFLEIWADGVLNSSYAISASGSIFSLTITYSGSLPSSLQFRFNDTSTEVGRSIEIRSVQINNRYVDINNYLSDNDLNQGDYSTVDIPSSDFIFNPNAEPLASEFTTGVSQTFTSGMDNFRGHTSITDEIFNLLDGNDYAMTGSGNDKISGGLGDDTIRGGAGNDLIFGDDGDDRLYGDDGNDRLFGGDGDDRIHGQAGNDEIHGGLGNDTLNGHDGDDIITGGEGDDKITGADGIDFLYGDDGDDQITGGAGDDVIDGGNDNDIIYAGIGDDKVYGGDGDDVIVGDAGNDELHGGDGDDKIYGLNDNDTIYGGNGNDELYGGAGADVITGGRGDDIINGGDGDDVISATTITSLGVSVSDILAANPLLTYSAVTGNFYRFVDNGTTNMNYASAVSAAASYTINGVAAHLATITSAAENSVVAGLVNGSRYGWIGMSDSAVEGTFRWTAGPENGTAVSGYTNWWGGGGPNPNSGTADNVLFWDGGGDTWYVWAGTNNAWGYIAEWEGSSLLSTGIYDSSGETNTLNGGAGNDTIYGSMGTDIFDGGTGNDTIYGGQGNDTLTFTSATAAVTVNLVNETATGATIGNDTFDSIENITGSDFNDVLTGDSGDNIIIGGAGNDSIYGGGGNDILIGGDGNDSITAGTAFVSGVTVADILAANPDVSYSSVTGNFYQFVAGSINYANSVTAANAYTLNGIGGHLATITSAAEHNFIGTIGSGGYGWIGLSDSAVEGTFRWTAGPENGMTVSGFTNWWGGGGPNPNSASADNVLYYHGGGNTWYVWAGTNSATGYVAEWEGSAVLSNMANLNTDTFSIAGGDGADVLYGSGSIDTFIFEAISAYNDVDQIENFVTGAGGDAIDISDLLTGFSGPITNWVNFVDSGGNTLVQVDSNGTAGGSSFTTIGQINDLTGLDEATLYAAGNIIV